MSSDSEEFKVTGKLDLDLKINNFIQHMFYSQFTFDEFLYILFDLNNFFSI